MEEATPAAGWYVVMGSVALGIVGALFYPFDLGSPDRFQQAAWQWAHFPLMVAVSWAMLRTWSHKNGYGPSRRIKGMVLLVGLVPLIEGLQFITGRHPDWADVGMGWGGLLTGALLYYVLRLRSPLSMGAGLLLVLLATAVASKPTVDIVMDRYRMEQEFPVLTAAEFERELSRWDLNGASMTRVREPAKNGWHCFRVDLTAAVDYPGIFMSDLVRDWRGYEQLCLVIAVDGTEPLSAWLRVDDRSNPDYQQRYQEAISLSPGHNHVCITWGDQLIAENGRKMDLSRIEQWGLFFAREEAAGRTIYLDAAYLVHP